MGRRSADQIFTWQRMIYNASIIIFNLFSRHYVKKMQCVQERNEDNNNGIRTENNKKTSEQLQLFNWTLQAHYETETEHAKYVRITFSD